ncbi:hypothetical protein VP1G_09742 [Cytospora mali]|uniref:Uncharacterized protein n=1 Tax=Cytospora mali TaxID=578113 RepID=A0A194VFQ1_CYTMA|nr:hypothetical protein VP1G_09742 [Valsa mali var. pyri (nom. inval.)]
MAPQTSIPVASTVLGTIGTILWCVQLIPQIWTNWRTKSTDGLPGSMMFLWALCGVPFGTYSVVQNFNIPIQVQPQVFMLLCLTSWAQTLVYSRGWRAWTTALLAVSVGAVFAGVEAALIITIRPIYAAGNETPVTVVGIVASVFLAAGLLPPYGEIWKRRGRVIGINWNSTTDYGDSGKSCVLEAGIFASHIIWRIRTRKIRKEAKAQGKTFDDIAAEHEERGIPFKFAERKSRKERRQQEKDIEEGRAVGMTSAEEPVRVDHEAESSVDDSTRSGAGCERSGDEKDNS